MNGLVHACVRRHGRRGAAHVLRRTSGQLREMVLNEPRVRRRAGDLRQGDNMLEFTTENGNKGYPVVISNIDLVISTACRAPTQAGARTPSAPATVATTGGPAGENAG